ncbi:MAG: PilZ domain-containing protein [Pseudolabrys sp.]
MEERRKVQRGRTLKAGSIVFNSAAGIDCRVRNMSAAGACLEVTSQVGVPNDFVLVVGYDKIQADVPTSFGVRTRA